MKIFIALCLLSSCSFAQNVVLSWSSFSTGGGIPTLNNTSARISAGQPFIGISALHNAVVQSGFIAPFAGQSFVTAVEDANTQPVTFELHQNFPNPFNPTTNIRYDIAVRSRVMIAVYNLLGQQVSVLVDDEVSPGRYNAVWFGKNNDGTQVSTGVYFYRIRAESVDGQKQTFVQTKKMILMK